MAGADPALDVGRGDHPELPALPGLLVEHLLELVARHLPADHAFPKLHDLVLVGHRRSSSASTLARERAWHASPDRWIVRGGGRWRHPVVGRGCWTAPHAPANLRG